ncbi:MAG: tetratricopeptide repeat protein [Verrucomicrobia bacterium]|nr:tetratricopeptide repeat protein [Verrucomicrobiota bacterium]
MISPFSRRMLWVLLTLAALQSGESQAPERPRSNRAPEPKEATGALLLQAQQAFQAGKKTEALALATKAVEAEPGHPRPYFIRGKIHELMRNGASAISDYDRVVALDKTAIDIYQFRGAERFKLGQIKEAVEDFDRYLTLRPDQAAHHWQRGIALYYLDRFEDGRKQFDLHQSVNANDVENAAWHYLCNARATRDPKKAAQQILPIQEDGRPSMMDLYALYRGTKSVEEVESAIRQMPAGEKKDQAEFYGALYIGLFYEAQQDFVKARPQLLKSARLSANFGYMGDVARVHVAKKYTP